MIRGRELWDKLAGDICNIVLNSGDNLIFLIGENCTGKSEIGKMLKDKILVLDDYRGNYEDIPKDQKVLVITHRLNLLLRTNAKLIITAKNELYTVTTCDFKEYGEITHLMYTDNLLSVLFNNAVSGCWSELNEMFLQEYVSTHEIYNSDKIVLKAIDNFNNRYKLNEESNEESIDEKCDKKIYQYYMTPYK